MVRLRGVSVVVVVYVHYAFSVAGEHVQLFTSCSGCGMTRNNVRGYVKLTHDSPVPVVVPAPVMEIYITPV